MSQIKKQMNNKTWSITMCHYFFLTESKPKCKTKFAERLVHSPIQKLAEPPSAGITSRNHFQFSILQRCFSSLRFASIHLCMCYRVLFSARRPSPGNASKQFIRACSVFFWWCHEPQQMTGQLRPGESETCRSCTVWPQAELTDTFTQTVLNAFHSEIIFTL